VNIDYHKKARAIVPFLLYNTLTFLCTVQDILLLDKQ